ncbi:hypothetical protein IP88_08300, partial [alpha proteobacterium AAP81b]
PPPGYASAPGYAPPPPQPAPAAAGDARLDFAAGEPELYGPEPLVAAAGRLIHLASRVRTMAIGPDLAQLRQLVVRELDRFTPRAKSLGIEAKSVQLAHYILCAFMDDAVMSTPWGANSPWSQHSLLAAYHNDVQGGTRLFDFAERMEQDPQREPRLMELLYQCLSLGFEGRAALDPRGANMLQQRRARLSSAIANRQGPPAGDLSPQWQGVAVAAGRFAPRVPLWAILAGLGVVALVIFSALLFRLSSQTDAAIAALNQAVGSAPIVSPPPPPETKTPTYDRFRAILAPDIRAGRLDVLREGNEIVVRLVNQGLFESGQADASSDWSATFGRLAEAANLTRGPMRIEGHTDNQAIRSLAFPSNMALSESRAASVGRALTAGGLRDPGRIATEGFGDARPIADNASADGRRENRRVELRVANDIAWR